MFLETIKIQDGVIQNLDLHQRRLEQTLLATYRQYFDINLSHEILVPKAFQKGCVKCRIVYDQEILEIKFNHYTIRPIETLQLVDIDFDYEWKYENRQYINETFDRKEKADDVLMLKKGLLTDTSYANIVLQIDGQLFTPKTPLFKGVKRRTLLDQGTIIEKELTIKHLRQAEYIILINALLELGEVKISPQNILNLK